MDGVTDSPPPSSTTHSASSNYLRFGVLGTASIARKNVRAIQMSPLCKLVAVASRDLDKAILFAKENRINLEECQLYGSYAELLVDPSVDAVYIPLPTSLHMEWVTKAAIAKKHILIEKPVAVTLAELQQMLQTCADNNVTLIDGILDDASEEFILR
jgi:predicted dehydrogenase